MGGFKEETREETEGGIQALQEQQQGGCKGRDAVFLLVRRGVLDQDGAEARAGRPVENASQL